MNRSVSTVLVVSVVFMSLVSVSSVASIGSEPIVVVEFMRDAG